MMKNPDARVIVWIAASAVLTSCQWGVPHNSKPDITKDTLVYSYRTVKDRASDCGNKPDSSCTIAKITYPVFSNQQMLNDSIAGKLINAYYLDKPDKSIADQAKNFIRFYEADTARNPDAFYTLKSNAAVVRQDSALLTIQIDRYAYSGGAHGSNYTGFFNWNTKESRLLSLDDIFAAGYTDKLTSLGEKIFRIQEKLSDTSSLDGYFFKNEKFGLNRNFLITPVGIRFLYNEYEIKPYSAGTTELLIPYTQIKSLLRPNTVVSQYIR